jgi:hypothetical protein
MSAAKHLLPVVVGIGLVLSGCGTSVPEIQENPWSHGAEALVQAIAYSIHCELRNSIVDVKVTDEKFKPKNGRLIAEWLDDWGAQVTLTLTIDEASAINPTGLYFPTKIFSLFGSANLSSNATRIDILSYYYTIKELQAQGPCSSSDMLDNATFDHPIGSLLIYSDLKLGEWLSSAVLTNLTGDFPVNNKNPKNGLTHHVTFKIVTSGTVNPSWKLEHAIINPTGPLFMANRTRTHDLLITFGPNTPTPEASGKLVNSLGATTPAAYTNLAAQIGIAITNQTVNNSLP